MLGILQASQAFDAEGGAICLGRDEGTGRNAPRFAGAGSEQIPFSQPPEQFAPGAKGEQPVTRPPRSVIR